MLTINNYTTPSAEQMMAVIRGNCDKNFRQTKNGKYEAYVSDKKKTIGLGTFDTKEEAVNNIVNWKVDKLLSALKMAECTENRFAVYDKEEEE